MWWCSAMGFIVMLILSLLTASLTADAQPPGNFLRIGLLIPGSSSGGFSSRIEAFRQELRDLGWVEGQQIALEYRYAENLDRLPDLAAELVRLPVALILAWGAASALAAQHATPTIPIVFVGVANPVGRGLVEGQDGAGDHHTVSQVRHQAYMLGRGDAETDGNWLGRRGPELLQHQPQIVC